MDGLVSIIIPAYNRAQLIIETLESVRLQSYAPIEILVVDDGSTDATVDVVSKWRDQKSVQNVTLLALKKRWEIRRSEHRLPSGTRGVCDDPGFG